MGSEMANWDCQAPDATPKFLIFPALFEKNLLPYLPPANFLGKIV